MEISVNKAGEKLAVVLEGRLDTNTSPELESSLKANLEGVTDLVIDLSAVQYVSSAGLRVILFAQKEMTKAAGTLKVLHPNDYIMDVFEATGFTDIIDIER